MFVPHIVIPAKHGKPRKCSGSFMGLRLSLVAIGVAVTVALQVGDASKHGRPLALHRLSSGDAIASACVIVLISAVAGFAVARAIGRTGRI